MKSTFNEIYDAFLIEMSLPKGFTSFDVMSIDDFLDQEAKNDNIVFVNVKNPITSTFENVIDGYLTEKDAEKDAENDAENEYNAQISDVDINKLKHQRMGDPSKNIAIARRPEKMLHKSNIVDENGKLLNNNKLKKMITTRPAKIIDQNTKLKKSGASEQVFYDLTLPSYMGLFVDESTGEFKIIRTCPAAGECSKYCYAAKGGYVMFPASGLNASRTVNFLMNDPDGFKEQILSELEHGETIANKKNNSVVLRWHDSGDFLSEKYIQLAFDIARLTPDVLHYAYTKQIPLVRKLEEQKPDNFVFNFSFGGIYDVDIDPLVDKHARVIPANLFKDLPSKVINGKLVFPEASIKALKQRVGKEFKVSPKTVLTYDELLNTPPSKSKKWNVLVWKGHGDDSATRKDVLGTYLLFH